MNKPSREVRAVDPALDARLQPLYARRAHGIKPGLEPVARLLEKLGSPQRRLSAIHVAGTNGKGSVCAMLESIVRRTGRRTGLYTSPHLLRFHERFQIDGEAVSDAVLGALIDAVEQADALAAAEPGGRPATFFEFATAMAFVLFREAGVDTAVVETGLGGRLDATNVLQPRVSVISRIDVDHTGWLGNSLEQIGGEKAGIIKPGVPVVLGRMPEAAQHVLEATAAERGAPCQSVEQTVTVQHRGYAAGGQRIHLSTSRADYGTLVLPLEGHYQLENTATATAGAECWADTRGMDLPVDNVVQGLSSVSWAGRCQWLCRDPAVLLDAAHNPGGAAALATVLKERVDQGPVALVTGVMRDKDAQGILHALQPFVRRAWTVDLPVSRAMPAAELAAIARTVGLEADPATLPVALAEALDWASRHKGMVCVAGSMYLAGDVLAHPEWIQAVNPSQPEHL